MRRAKPPTLVRQGTASGDRAQGLGRLRPVGGRFPHESRIPAQSHPRPFFPAAADAHRCGNRDRDRDVWGRGRPASLGNPPLVPCVVPLVPCMVTLVPCVVPLVPCVASLVSLVSLVYVKWDLSPARAVRGGVLRDQQVFGSQ